MLPLAFSSKQAGPAATRMAVYIFFETNPHHKKVQKLSKLQRYVCQMNFTAHINIIVIQPAFVLVAIFQSSYDHYGKTFFYSIFLV